MKLKALVDTSYTNIDVDGTFGDVYVNAGDIIEGLILRKHDNHTFHFGFEDGNTAELVEEDWTRVPLTPEESALEAYQECSGL